MIYEFRTYDLKPRGVPEFERAFGEKLPERVKFSRWVACGIQKPVRSIRSCTSGHMRTPIIAPRCAPRRWRKAPGRRGLAKPSCSI